jgi:GntR family transcriptional repressor for pyruvate dehydrogenase complex
VQQLRQPRLAEIIAAKLRDDILTGKLAEGDLIPRQEQLLRDFRTSLPAVREALRILETEGLISVRRGNVGGAVVHLPSPDRVAQITSMVLQSRRATPDDVSATLARIEPICAGMCAARADRDINVIPYLQAIVDAQEANFDDIAQWNANARRFHEELVKRCGSETMIVLIGALEVIWSAHESAVWDEAGGRDIETTALAERTRRAAVRDHVKLVTAIAAGQKERAVSLSAAHLAATRHSTLASSRHEVIQAKLVSAAEHADSA